MTPWVARWMKPNRPSSPEDASRSSSGSLASASRRSRDRPFRAREEPCQLGDLEPRAGQTREGRRIARAVRWRGAAGTGAPLQGDAGRLGIDDRAKVTAGDFAAGGLPVAPDLDRHRIARRGDGLQVRRACAARCRCKPGARPRPSGRVSRHWSRGRRP